MKNVQHIWKLYCTFFSFFRYISTKPVTEQIQSTWKNFFSIIIVNAMNKYYAILTKVIRKWSTLEGWKAKSTLEPHIGQLDQCLMNPCMFAVLMEDDGMIKAIAAAFDWDFDLMLGCQWVWFSISQRDWSHWRSKYLMLENLTFKNIKKESSKKSSLKM